MVLLAVTLSDLSRWARSSGLEIVLLLTGSALLARFLTWLRDRVTARIDADIRSAEEGALVRSEQAKHRHAMVQVIAGTAVVLVYFITGILVLQRLQVPLTSLVAPVAVIGVAVGFGAQRLVQDLLAGFFIIAERQYGFGDVVRIAPPGTTTGVMGTVEEVSLRLTRLRTVSGEVLILPNGEIRQVTNFSRDWARTVIDIPVPADTDINRVNAILRSVGEEAFADAELRPLLLDPPSVMGVESLDVGFFKIRVVARTLPGKQFDVGRELRARVAVAFQAEGISVLSTFLGTAPPAGI